MDLCAYRDPQLKAISASRHGRHWSGLLGRSFSIMAVPARKDWEWQSHESDGMLKAVAEALAPHGYAVPSVTADFNAGSHSRKHRIVIRTYMPGMSLDKRLAALSPQKKVHVYREMGHLLGLLHQHVPASAAPERNHDWNIPPGPAVARLELNLFAHKHGWNKRKIRLFNRIVDIIERDQADDNTQPHADCFVHSDYAERNLISAPNGKIRGLIDFELSTRSGLYTEWANLSTHWPEDIRHVLHGYNKITGLSVQPHELFACRILQSINFTYSREIDPVWTYTRLTDDATEWARAHPRLHKQTRKAIMALD